VVQPPDVKSSGWVALERDGDPERAHHGADCQFQGFLIQMKGRVYRVVALGLWLLALAVAGGASIRPF
jgi:hypothetical protein